jgi:hypothetical protein
MRKGLQKEDFLNIKERDERENVVLGTYKTFLHKVILN